MAGGLMNQAMDSKARNESSDAPDRKVRLLLVDDDVVLLRSLERLLRNKVDVTTASNAAAALAHVHERFDIVLADYRMPQMDGVELLKQLQQLDPHALRALTSGETIPRLRSLLATQVVHHFLPKPIEHQPLLDLLRVAQRNSASFPPSAS
jgi:two-component system probable response regulator PhcQ